MKYIIGIGLILFAVIVVGATFIPMLTEEINYKLSKVSTPTEIKKTEPIDKEFGIMIPKIGANAHVIKDVDPFDAQVYQQALTKGVAHALGSALPDRKGNIFLFSHSSSDFLNATKYNSIFYLINKLEKDDPISIFYEDKEYIYTVVGKKTVEADAVSYLQVEESDEKTLTLMTCWPPGTSLKRLLVFAKLQK